MEKRKNYVIISTGDGDFLLSTKTNKDIGQINSLIKGNDEFVEIGEYLIRKTLLNHVRVVAKDSVMDEELCSNEDDDEEDVSEGELTFYSRAIITETGHVKNNFVADLYEDSNEEEHYVILNASNPEYNFKHIPKDKTQSGFGSYRIIDSNRFKLSNKRVLITKIDGVDVSFVADLEPIIGLFGTHLYVIKNATDPMMDDCKIFEEKEIGFGVDNQDYYKEIKDSEPHDKAIYSNFEEDSNWAGKRVRVTRLNGGLVDFVATLEYDDSIFYKLVDCTEGRHNGRPIFRETDDGYGKEDYYEIIEPSEYEGQRVHVTKYNQREADFVGTVKTCNESFYVLSDCTDKDFNNKLLFKETSDGFGVFNTDYYKLVEDDEKPKKKHPNIGRRILVSRIDYKDVNIEAVITGNYSHGESLVYELKIICSNDNEYEDEAIIYTEDNFNFGENKEDYFVFVDELVDY